MRCHRLIPVLMASLVLLIVSADAAAMYAPRLGRFMQRDPIGYPDGMSTYAGYHAMRGAVDPSGMTIVVGIRDPSIDTDKIIDRNRANRLAREWMQFYRFHRRVEGALNDLCPCLSFRVNGEDGLFGNFHVRTVTASKWGEMTDKESCDCLQRHRVGCGIIMSLIDHRMDLFIRHRPDDQGSYEPYPLRPERQVGGIVRWNPMFEGGSRREVVSTSREHKHLRPSMVLGHELTHAHDQFNRLLTDRAWDEKVDALGRVGRGVPRREILAVRAENQIFRELTGMAGGRTHYGSEVLNHQEGRTDIDPCDCEKTLDGLATDWKK